MIKSGPKRLNSNAEPFQLCLASSYSHNDVTLLFLDSYNDMILPCLPGMRASVMQGVREHQVDIYRLCARALETKRM